MPFWSQELPCLKQVKKNYLTPPLLLKICIMYSAQILRIKSRSRWRTAKTFLYCVRYFAELYTSALLFYGSLEGRWNICRQASSFMLWSFQQVEQEGKTSNRWRVDFVGCYCACSAKRLKHLNLLFLKWNNHLVLNYLPLFNTYVFRISMANEIKGSTRKAWNKSEEFATQIYRVGKC